MSVDLDSVGAATLEGVVNFRDVGGLPLAGGGAVRLGVLFRSGHLAGATEDDVQQLDRLGVRCVADLRRPRERERFPTPASVQEGARMLGQTLDTEEEEAPHLAFLLEPGVTQESLAERMCNTYRAFPYDAGLASVFCDYFTALAELGTGEALLVHCHAGKDRTGLLVALTLDLLGAEPAGVRADYLRTNRDNRIERRLPEVARTFEETHNVAPDLALLRAVMAVETRFLDAAFAAIVETDGSIAGYLNNQLGVDAAKAQHIRRVLTRA